MSFSSSATHASILIQLTNPSVALSDEDHKPLRLEHIHDPSLEALLSPSVAIRKQPSLLLLQTERRQVQAALMDVYTTPHQPAQP